LLDASRRFFALAEGYKVVNSSQFRGHTRTGKKLTNGETD